MINKQILAYIQQNLQAGFEKPQIEASLKEAGWGTEDVEAAFTAIESSDIIQSSIAAAKAKPHPEATKVSDLQRIANEEVAVFDESAKLSAERTERDFSTEETGIYGFLLRNNLANNHQSANILMLGSLFVGIVLLYWIFLH